MGYIIAQPEGCEDVTARDLITKDNIMRTEYRRRLRTKMTVYEIPDYMLGERLGSYLVEYGQLVSVTPEYETGECGGLSE